MKASYFLTGKNVGKIVLRIDGNVIEPIASDKVIEDVETRVSEIKNSPSVYFNELNILNEYLRVAGLPKETLKGVTLEELSHKSTVTEIKDFNWEDAKKKMENAVKKAKDIQETEAKPELK